MIKTMMKNDAELIDLAIIGGGPAGLSAGLYATRGGIKSAVLFEMAMLGGQITGSSDVKNYPGVKEKRSGMELMADWQEQCLRFGLRQERGKITRIAKSGKIFTLWPEGGKTICAKAVILATGAYPRRTGIKGEGELWGKGVSICATCDGMLYRKKEVAVLGGGDNALEKALYLAEMCQKVYLIHRREEFRAARVSVNLAKAHEKIEFLTPYVVEEIKGDAMGVTGLSLKNLKSGEAKELEVPALFIFAGYEVNNSFLTQEDGSMLCEVDAYGSVVVDLSMRTNVAGLFAAGDLRADSSKKAICAAGDGATAALQAIAYLDALKQNPWLAS